jgi:ribosome maturation factor RimP
MTIMLKNADHVHFCDRDEAAHDGFKLVMLSMAEDEQLEADLDKMKDADKCAQVSRAIHSRVDRDSTISTPI